jgi:hypothetical protein
MGVLTKTANKGGQKGASSTDTLYDPFPLKKSFSFLASIIGM